MLYFFLVSHVHFATTPKINTLLEINPHSYNHLILGKFPKKKNPKLGKENLQKIAKRTEYLSFLIDFY